MKITKDSIIADVISYDPSTVPFFLNIGMHCIGCPASMGETIEEACMVHGIECDDLIDMLNEHIGQFAEDL